MNDPIAQSSPLQWVADNTPCSPTVVPPLTPHRQRPRVREVSSRFMSSVVYSSSSPGDLQHHLTKPPLPKHGVSTPTPQLQHRSKSVQKPHWEVPPDPLCTRADENIPETTRSLESPLGLHIKASIQRKRRAAVKAFKENGCRSEQQQISSDVLQSRSLPISGKLLGRGVAGNNVTLSTSRPDTPTVSTTGAGHRIVSSRFGLGGSTQKTKDITATATAAAKLLQSSGMCSSLLSSAQPPDPDSDCNNGNHADTSKETGSCSSVAQALAELATLSTGPDIACTSSPIGAQSSKTTWSIPDLRSSFPEVDVLPNLSTRLLSERSCTRVGNFIICNSSKSCPSPCSRSLNLPLSTCEHSSSLHTVKPREKTLANSVKIGSLCLPPCPKQGADSRRGRKDFTHQEEVHSLKLLHNHHLQWRYANAKAEASTDAQRRETERELYSLVVKISNLHDALRRKHMELRFHKRTKTLSAILEAQMSYLDEWSTSEGEYVSSLTGVFHALLNASLQLPVCQNVQVDAREIGEALNAALKMTETVCFHIQSFMPKAEEMAILISELARVIGGERALVEECGHLLFKRHISQVEECSLRGHLIQLHSNNHRQAKEE